MPTQALKNIIEELTSGRPAPRAIIGAPVRHDNRGPTIIIDGFRPLFHITKIMSTVFWKTTEIQFENTHNKF